MAGLLQLTPAVEDVDVHMIGTTALATVARARGVPRFILGGAHCSSPSWKETTPRSIGGCPLREVKGRELDAWKSNVK
jgi:hypothetical protein